MHGSSAVVGGVVNGGCEMAGSSCRLSYFIGLGIIPVSCMWGKFLVCVCLMRFVARRVCFC